MTELLPSTDEELAEKFRREHNEQFNILVRMHLSFVLDLNTEENECFTTDKNKFKKWTLVPFNKKVKCQKGVMDGAPLTQEGICQVYQLIEFLKKEQNIVVEGIFRRTGSLARQQELRSLLNQGITLDLEGGTYSIHDCASVLKGFLAELPDPLLTEAHYPAYCQIAELCGVIEKPTQEDKLLVALQLLLLLLPSENKILLKDILELLNFTASYESSNRMSPDNLAKLFTPHLLCPRKLTPEQLHVNSQNLCGIVAFMINKYEELFKIPKKLLVDFRAKYENRKSTNRKCLNESVNDQFAANTVFTFIDQERTSKENEANTTETALAQLYAHIQSLPESSKKRKLVKQFNKENGHGTPLQILRSNVQKKSLGDSIKRHIFSKGLYKKGLSQLRASSEETLESPKAVKMQTNCDSSSNDVSKEDKSMKKRKLSLSSENLINDDNKLSCLTTSTPACKPVLCEIFTPEEQGRRSMSPITRSTQRMSKAMQETMMTPRSRKPVLLVSGTNINNLAQLENKEITPMDNLEEECSENLINEPDSLTSNFKKYLNSRSMITSSSPAVDSTFSSRTDDFNSTEFDNEKMSESLLRCLNGEIDESDGEKKLVLKPKQFDENGHPIVFETSF